MTLWEPRRNIKMWEHREYVKIWEHWGNVMLEHDTMGT